MVRLDLHIRDIRLIQLQHALVSFEPCLSIPSTATTKPSKDGGQTEIHLRIGQIDPRALPAALGESYQVPVQPWVLEPPLWAEGGRIREYQRVLVDQNGGHSDGGARWDDPFFTFAGPAAADCAVLRGGRRGRLFAKDERFEGRDTLQPRGYTIAQPQGLLHHSDQIGTFFQSGDGNGIAVSQVGDGGAEFALQPEQARGVREQVEGGHAEGPRCGVRARGDDDLGFVFQAWVHLFGFWEVARQDFMEYGRIGVVFVFVVGLFFDFGDVGLSFLLLHQQTARKSVLL